MNVVEKLYNAFSGKEYLLTRLEQSWRLNEDEARTHELLKEAGVELSDELMQDLLSLRQKIVLKTITTQELDLEQLAAVSGGGTGICEGTASCDFRFKHDCTRHNSNTPEPLRCIWFDFCDEHNNVP